MLTQVELHKRFDHHPPSSEAVGVSHGLVRQIMREATSAILQNIPADSREASVFVTKMEEAMFWANAAIARNQ